MAAFKNEAPSFFVANDLGGLGPHEVLGVALLASSSIAWSRSVTLLEI